MRAVCESFQLAKDAGFKVVSHMMPDLPNVGMERDVEQFIVSVLIFVQLVLRLKHDKYGCINRKAQIHFRSEVKSDQCKSLFLDWFGPARRVSYSGYNHLFTAAGSR